jgi:16S rRNA U516 pseudouridylate synthase RsuA-like enzyme
MNAAKIQAALDNLQNQLITASANPKPTYSVDGQSVSWNEYLRMLTDGIKSLNEMLSMADPVEFRTVAA